ncbi:hypothetical protein LUZ60_007136 [Juncus effusus]|nr:hypothetical protein LUZ60_007136 [Juncus effusus]
MESTSEQIKSSTQDPEWSDNPKSQQLQVDTISTKLSNLDSKSISKPNQELEFLKRRIQTISTLLTSLTPKSNPTQTLETSSTLSLISHSFQTLIPTIETLTTRLTLAESDSETSKLRVKLGLEELQRKSSQIHLLESRVFEMEKFSLSTTELLTEMRERVEEMAAETGRQRERAAENEAELIRVKRDFEGLRGFVGTLIDARESVLDSEKTLKSVEKVFDRMMVKNSQLETEKAQKDVEIKKLIEENVKLRAKLDQKEAQLAAMNEQFKFMALNDCNF